MLAVPESTYCSAQTTRPLPAQRSSTPASASARHSLARAGSRSPRSQAIPPRRSPATVNRTPAMREGGTDSTPTRIARQVDPQTRQTISQARSARPRNSPTRHLLDSHRQHAGLLEDGGEHDRRPGGGGLALGTEGAQDLLQALDRGHRDLEDVTILARHMMAFEDVGMVAELQDPRLGADVIRRGVAHRDERGDRPPDPAAVEARAVALDDPLLVEALDPLHDRGPGEPDFVSQALVGGTAVLGEEAEEGQAGGVEEGGCRGNRGHLNRRMYNHSNIRDTNSVSTD